MNWEENKHPRDSDGKFTDKGGGTPAERKRLEEMGISIDKEENQTLSAEEQKLKEKGINIDNLETQVDKILNGTYKDSHITLCEKTPKILQEIGVHDKPFVITSKHAYLAIKDEGKYEGVNDHYHGLGKETFLRIPSLLQSPIMVFKNHNAKDEIIAVVNALDKNKKPVILPIKINATGSINHIIVDVNLVKSIYGRNNLQNYIDKNVREEDMLLIENKKIRNLNSN